MKLHEETWSLEPAADGNLGLYASTPDGKRYLVTVLTMDKHRARLAAQAPAMARLLLENLERNFGCSSNPAMRCGECLECRTRVALSAGGVLL